MTRIETTSKRKAKALRYLVDSGEYSAQFASHELEEKHDEGKILDADYEPLAEYLDELMNRPVEVEPEIVEEPIEEYNDITEEVSDESEGEVE